MKSGAVFSCTVLSYDRRRKKGGEVIEYHEAQLYQQGTKNVTNMTAIERKIYERNQRKPNHGVNFTRNIRLLQAGYPTDILRKLHPPLVMQFNGKTVLG